MKEEPPATAAPGKGFPILIADDSMIQRKLLERRLIQLGFEVIPAEDGQKALELAQTSSPRALITDVSMPGLDGFALCRVIRSDPRLASIPVLLTSATALDEKERQLSSDAGATAFIMRTPTFQEVIAALLQALGLQQGE